MKKPETRHARARMTRLFTMIAATIFMLLPLVGVNDASAQEDEKPGTTYTMVAQWEVDRDHWSDFVEMYEKHDQPIMEKLFADGTVTEWGFDADILHSPDGFTHSTWYSAESMSGLMAAGEALMKAWEEQGSDTDAEFNAMIGNHRDVIIETEGMRSKAATLDGGYFQGHMVKLSQGKQSDFMSYWKHRMKPIYEQLLNDGDIIAYGISTEAVATHEMGMTNWWYFMADAGGFDKIDAAFDSSWGDMDSEGRRARWLSILEVVEEETYRSSISRVIHMQVAAH